QHHRAMSLHERMEGVLIAIMEETVQQLKVGEGQCVVAKSGLAQLLDDLAELTGRHLAHSAGGNVPLFLFPQRQRFAHLFLFVAARDCWQGKGEWPSTASV